jgi:LysM repeat protein
VAAAPAKPETNPPVAAAPEVVPTKSLPDAPATVAPIPAPATAKSYTVVKGDSFYKIAKAKGVSVKALMAANPGVESAKLKVGQKLKLPETRAAATAGAQG